MNEPKRRSFTLTIGRAKMFATFATCLGLVVACLAASFGSNPPLLLLAAVLMALATGLSQIRVRVMRMTAVEYLYTVVLGDPDMGDDTAGDRHDLSAFDIAVYKAKWSGRLAYWRLLFVVSQAAAATAAGTVLLTLAMIGLIAEVLLEKAFVFGVREAFRRIQASEAGEILDA